MKQIWSVLATKSIIDKSTNMISMIDACDHLRVHSADLPDFDNKAKEHIAIGGVSLHLITMWFRSDYEKPEKGLSRTLIVTPDGKKFMQPERVVDLGSVGTSREILVIDKLIYRGLGLYLFRIEQKKEDRKRWTLEAEVPLILTSDDAPQAGRAD